MDPLRKTIVSLLTICLVTLISNAQDTLVALEDSMDVETDTKVADAMTVTDIDGNTYKTVQIGDQVWMAENLRVTRYADGTPLVDANRRKDWKKRSLMESTYCWPSEDSAKYAGLYGAFYSWKAATRGVSSTRKEQVVSQGICPEGWHLPTDAEWKQLEKFLGMSENGADLIKYRGNGQGSMLAAYPTLWIDGELEEHSGFGATGFNAIPSGYRYDYGHFYTPGYETFWWTSTEFNPNFGWCRGLSYTTHQVYRYTNEKQFGFSVRCVKDQ